MKILVVDDNTANRKYLRVLLTQEGHAVFEAEDGLEALCALDRENIDAVISDVLMPRMDGYRLCYEIRKNPKLNPIPFIAYSAAYTSSRDEQVALDFGADRFLAKPALPEVIIEALHQAVEKRESRAKPFRAPDELSAMKEYSETLVRKLEETNTELSRANHALNERAVLAEFIADISNALKDAETLPVILQLCTEAMVRRLNAAFARIWTYNPKDHVLELQASAGMYTHLNGGHGRVPVGQFKIGLIASERKPHLTNSVIGDPRVNDQEWAKREGMIAFAGYPLLVEDKLVGVMAMFARKVLTQSILLGMESVSNAVAATILRKRIDEEKQRETERSRAILESALDCIITMDHEGKVLEFNPAAERTFGYSRSAVIGKDLAELIIPPQLREQHRRGLAHYLTTGHGPVLGKRIDITALRSDGTEFPVELIISPMSIGERTTFTGFIRDISERKQAEAHIQRNIERMEALREIEKSITSTLDLNTVLNVLLEKIDILFTKSSVTTVRLFDKETGQLEPVAARNIEVGEWIAAMRGVQDNQESYARVVVEQRGPLVIANLQTDARSQNPHFYREHGLISYAGVPLIAKGEILGVLAIYTKEEHSFSGEEIELLMILAGQTAIAIHNARLYAETDQSKKELETTNQYLEKSLQQLGGFYAALTPITAAASIQDRMTGIIARFMTATGADAVSIRLLDKDTGAHPIVAQRGFSEEFIASVGAVPPGGAVNWVARRGEAIIAPDIASDGRFKSKAQLQSGLRSCAILPLAVHNEVRGVIHLASRTPRYFAEEQRDHLTAIARQMSIALENHELFAGLQSSRDELARTNIALTERNRMLSALHEMAVTASQSLDLERVLHAAIEKINDIFRFDATRIHLADQQSGELVLRASLENDPERFTVARSFTKGQGIVGKAAVSGKSFIFEDTQSDPLFQQLSRSTVSDQYGYRFFAVLPINSREINLGTLACVGTAPRKLNSGELQLLEALTGQLAVAIDNSNLYEKVLQNVQNLEQKTTELQVANKVKDDFLAVISHELRTPLNVIMGYTTLLHDGTLGNVEPAQFNALKKVQHQSRSLLKMVDSILDVPLLESRHQPIDRGEVSLDTLLADVRADCAAPARKDLTLVWDCTPDLPVIKTDAKKLKRIIDNLIDNAVKFTDHGRITVSARVCAPTSNGSVRGRRHPSPAATGASDRMRDNWIELKVTDTGVGISSEALSHVFDKFYQVDSSATREFGGMGLGLFIAKEFTELLGGSIEAESAVGKGSTFTIKIPCEQPDTEQV